MEYQVRITAKAMSDAVDAYLWIADDSPERAAHWFNGLLDAIHRLDALPTGYPLAPESRGMSVEIRQLLYGKRSGVYRVLFRVLEDEKTVLVMRIRHSARLSLDPDELLDLD